MSESKAPDVGEYPFLQNDDPRNPTTEVRYRGVLYRRADIPWLPQELVMRGQQAIYKWEKHGNCEACARLLREFMVAVEQRP